MMVLPEMKKLKAAIRDILVVESEPVDMKAAQSLSVNRKEPVNVVMIQNQILQTINLKVVSALAAADELEEVIDVTPDNGKQLREGQHADTLDEALLIAAGLCLDSFMTWKQSEAKFKEKVFSEARRRYPSQNRAAEAVGINNANFFAYFRRLDEKCLAEQLELGNTTAPGRPRKKPGPKPKDGRKET